MTADVHHPHPAIHRTHGVICSLDHGCIVGLSERPADRIAAALLEDVGDWHRAVKALTRTEVPPAVSDALDALHEAVCGWTDWTAAQHRTTEPK